MKKYLLIIMSCMLFFSCKKEYLEVNPLGSVDENILATKQGVNGVLIGAYSLLDGVGTGGGDIYGSNLVLATIPSDDAHTGTIPNGILAQIEGFTTDATSAPFNNRWLLLYSSVQRTNDVLRILSKVNGLTTAETKQIKSEALFLRAFYHMESAKMWKNVPFVDESVTYQSGNFYVSNTPSIWPKIEEDFKFAAANLSETNSEVGRANSWAAKSFLAKAYMFQNKFADAKTLLDDIIANGKTVNGLKYALQPLYHNNFATNTKHSSEAVFTVQMSVNDGSSGQNGNFTDTYGGPFNSPASAGYGWLQPSFDLVNSYQTDAVTGLPLLDTYQNTPVKSDQGIASTAAFIPYIGTLDSRLDWNVGRRGIPFLDWGYHPGQAWVRQQSSGGPYNVIKHISSKVGVTERQTKNTNNPYNLIRFADILLWAAEVEVEIGSLRRAEEFVNLIRARAANPVGFVKKYINDNPDQGFSNIPAANYKVGLYTGQFTANGKDFARKALRFERRLELAFEHHRLFDLRRYDNGTGYMADLMNKYLKFEASVPNYNNSYMIGSIFTKGQDELYPIPQIQIDLSKKDGVPTLIQNPNY